MIESMRDYGDETGFDPVRDAGARRNAVGPSGPEAGADVFTRVLTHADRLSAERAARSHLQEGLNSPVPIPALPEHERILAMIGPVGVLPERAVRRIEAQLAHQRQIHQQGVLRTA